MAATAIGAGVGYKAGKFDLTKSREAQAKKFFDKYNKDQAEYSFDRERLRKKGYLRPYTGVSNAAPGQKTLPTKKVKLAKPQPKTSLFSKFRGRNFLAGIIAGAAAGAIKKYYEEKKNPQSLARKQDAIDAYRKMQMYKYAQKKGLDKPEEYVRYLKAKRRDDAFYSALDNSKDPKFKKNFLPVLGAAFAARTLPYIIKASRVLGKKKMKQAISGVGKGLKKAWGFFNTPGMQAASMAAMVADTAASSVPNKKIR